MLRDVILWTKKADLLSYAFGQREEALRSFAQALAIDPLHATAWKGKAMTEDAMGRYGEARQSYRKFIEIASPQNEPQIVAMGAQARLRVRELESADNCK